MLNIKRSILKTLIYSDIFDYPLTFEEIWKFLISEKKINKKEFFKNLKNLPSPISKKDKFYFLENRDSIIQKRIEKEKESEIKLRIAKKVVSYLSKIPTVLLIGISGTVAMKNADKKEDIDLFVITKKNTLWMTRFFIMFLLEILGLRRKRNDQSVENKICVNMLIDESAIYFEKNRQDLYTAHEIAQMKPVFDRDKTYQKFLASNSWVNKFLPNAINTKGLKYKDTNKKNRGLFDSFFKKVQLWYMKKHRTKEVILDHLIAFHPVDVKNKTLLMYNAKIKKHV
ncbi:MAG: hypothetical protein M1268_00835 [Patescibacteria group bacterium]|nr:hypothetical protein [Patescibacteria group bacterium]